ncbi:MAG TPA: FKBP-type peptidyl-prolyl cis-trans isomerase [Candidatus Kapabacteria bacterium]|nr:FKBP-type peptidyl-prolyl cis-trans isomerase [Candidatus Kapabacteria bacterium]HPO63939.1 FKBP-type peptidyl-prolyl cis-trans isomerase [Candidatus Kapabacteria bacterium]
MKKTLIIALIAISFILSACSSAKETSKDELTMIKTASGLQYGDILLGKGELVKSGQKLTVHYVGTFLDGTKFDSSRDRNQPFIFTIGNGQVIKGWEEGIMGMRVGGKRKLIIPPDLGYGKGGSGDIPANSTLVFEVELLDAK